MYRSFLAFRYIRSRLVNLISIGGVMVGVAVLIVVTAVMDGFQERVRSVLRGNLSHLILAPQRDPIPDFEQLARELKQEDPRIVGVAPQVTAPMGYFFTDRRRGGVRFGGRPIHVMTGVGLDWATEKAIEAELVKRHGASAREGALQLVVAVDPQDPFASVVAREQERTPVLVGRSFARSFFGLVTDEQLRLALEQGLQVDLMIEARDASGQSTALHVGKNLVITGFYDGGDQAEDRARLLFRRADLVLMADLGEPWHEARVWLSDYDEAANVKASLSARHPELNVETWEDQRSDFLRAVRTEKVLLVIVLSFIVLLGGFIILATLTLTVVEKTRDIGVLAALGAPRLGILSIFLRNGFYIGLLGSGLGLALGAFLVANLNSVKEFFDARGVQLFPPDIYLFTQIPTVWSWPTIFTIMGGSVLVAFLAGLLPALRAARLDPVVALRHE